MKQFRSYAAHFATPSRPNDKPAHVQLAGKRLIRRRDGNNVPTVSYTRGHDLSGSLEGAGGIGGLLVRSHGYSGGSWTNHNCYHADGGGNITYLMSSAQGLAARYRYDPYGRLLSSSGPLAGANLYRFAGKEVNPNYPDAGGYYSFGYRFYDPNLQRWLHRDPLGEAGGINLYAYVFNTPGYWVDPYGLYTFSEWMEICGAFLQGAGQGLTAVIDGALPIVDPFTRAGLYDAHDPTLKFSQTCGTVAACVAGTAGGIRGAATGFGKYGGISAKPVIVSRWGRPGLQADDWVMRGPPNRLNYTLSGKYQPSWMPGGNIPAPFSCGQTFNVPASTLQVPPGFFWGPLKGAIGQSIYRP